MVPVRIMPPNKSTDAAIVTVPLSTSDDWVEAARRCGTDKLRYMTYYWYHLQDYQAEPINLLEIGVFRGESLEMWKKLFPEASIHALDLNPDCRRYSDPPRVEVTIGSQAVPKDLESWMKQVSGPIDVIIDDGSHVMEHLKIAFLHLFPRLKSGGIYVIEDLGTCYFPEYGGELRNPSTMMEFLKSLVDNINSNCSKLANPLQIDHIHFYDNICFIHKQ